ncbi:PREDICTED: membrane-spanning 4-domains subfamily A member 5 [Miniopterus natalensis]|uniref:membrane-spanning 4-domains subfamily A member 5 n=1 Tax=Miniopterus natalensis TaxID=291302 RepID=UPI0007A7000F|nr:PREDICTED: membrane-spanning 4-domains subfamily A member 5 [Miniopterus natalensis]
MGSKTVRNPVFMIFPPEVTAPDFPSTKNAATAYGPTMPFSKLFTTKFKIFGTIQILLGLMNFSLGVIFFFTFEKPYPRFPFIFVTGYPFWSSVLFIYSGACLIALERKGTKTLVRMSQTMNCFSVLAATTGVLLLVFGFILDQNYLCGYSGEASECKAVNTLFIGILIMLIAFSIIQLLIAMSFSICSKSFDCCDCEEWC